MYVYNFFHISLDIITYASYCPVYTPLRSKNGNELLRNLYKITARWWNHFKGLLNRISHVSPDAIDVLQKARIIYQLHLPLTLKEIKAAVEHR